MQNDYILEMHAISKLFPGVKALSDVSLKIKAGDVHAIVGENGAGKSTLIKILSGSYTPDEGEIYFCGEKVLKFDPISAIDAGISTVHQELRVIESLTVTENIYLGRHITKSGLIDWKIMREQAHKLFEDMGVDVDVDELVGNLSVAKKQLIEICKATSKNAKLIIMDEPSATLTKKEMETLYESIDRLRKQNITIIYISHRLDEVFRIADRITVLRDGQHIKTMDVAETDRDNLISLMVGRTITQMYPQRTAKPTEVVMQVKDLTRKEILSHISFDLRKGEILGIAGLVGAGRTELARAIVGLDKIDTGEIWIKGSRRQLNSIYKAIGQKIALVPEERKTQGIIPEMSVLENITVVGLSKYIKTIFINKNLQQQDAGSMIEALRISTPSCNATIKNLSGGNQQKCVLAKWLLVDSDIFIFDEPTRGIDVGAKEEIYRLLNRLTESGKSIIMISSELPEIVGMSDRVLVMQGGRISAELIREEISQERIMQHAIN